MARSNCLSSARMIASVSRKIGCPGCRVFAFSAYASAFFFLSFDVSQATLLSAGASSGLICSTL